MCPNCRSHLGCIHCLPETAAAAPRDRAAEIERKRELGLVCGRLYSPSWLIARAKRNAGRLISADMDLDGGRHAVTGRPLTCSVLPVDFALA